MWVHLWPWPHIVSGFGLTVFSSASASASTSLFFGLVNIPGYNCSQTYNNQTGHGVFDACCRRLLSSNSTNNAGLEDSQCVIWCLSYVDSECFVIRLKTPVVAVYWCIVISCSVYRYFVFLSYHVCVTRIHVCFPRFDCWSRTISSLARLSPSLWPSITLVRKYIYQFVANSVSSLTIRVATRMSNKTLA